MAVGSGRGQVWETLPYHGDMRAKVSVKPFKNSDIKKRGGGVFSGNYRNYRSHRNYSHSY